MSQCKQCGYDCMALERLLTETRSDAMAAQHSAKLLEEQLTVVYEFLKVGKGQDALRFLEAGQGE